jgi:hypothetical protein
VVVAIGGRCDLSTRLRHRCQAHLKNDCLRIGRLAAALSSACFFHPCAAYTSDSRFSGASLVVAPGQHTEDDFAVDESQSFLR